MNNELLNLINSAVSRETILRHVIMNKCRLEITKTGDKIGTSNIGSFCSFKGITTGVTLSSNSAFTTDSQQAINRIIFFPGTKQIFDENQDNDTDISKIMSTFSLAIINSTVSIDDVHYIGSDEKTETRVTAIQISVKPVSENHILTVEEFINVVCNLSTLNIDQSLFIIPKIVPTTIIMGTDRSYDYIHCRYAKISAHVYYGNSEIELARKCAEEGAEVKKEILTKKPAPKKPSRNRPTKSQTKK